MIHFIILYALAAVSIGLGIAIFLKVKTAIYLLEQPVVKKMSPQLNLKPIKVDQVEGDAARNASRNGTPMNRPTGRDGQDRGPGAREGRGEDRGGRDRMPRADREPRGDREPRVEREGGDRSREGRGGEGDRGPRGDRFGGREGGRDRDRGGRDGHRHERGERGPRREFSGEREPAHAESARPAAPAADGSSPAPLAPRRPLPSTVDHEETKPAVAAIEANEAGAADPFFGRDDADIQHGRRNQLKKKPKFDEAEVEEKAATEETKVL